MNIIQQKWLEVIPQIFKYRITIRSGTFIWVLSWYPSVKESACQLRRHKRHRFDPWVGKIPWNRKWQPTQIFLQENLMDGRDWKASGVAKSQTYWEYHTCKKQVKFFLSLQGSCFYLKIILLPKVNILGWQIWLLHRERAQSFHTLCMHVTLPKSPCVHQAGSFPDPSFW